MGKKVKITWEEGIKEKLHEACREYFSTLDIEIIKNHFNIILNSEPSEQDESESEIIRKNKE